MQSTLSRPLLALGIALSSLHDQQQQGRAFPLSLSPSRALFNSRPFTLSLRR
jgi:hypothetical protein